MPNIKDIEIQLAKMMEMVDAYTGDVTVLDDLTVTDDAAIGGDLTVTGETIHDVLQAAEHGPGAIGTGTILAPRTYRRTENGIIIKTIKIDITGLSVLGTQAKDCIGLAAGTPIAYIGRYVVATDGVCFRIEMSCIEVPGQGTATITQDIDLGADGVGTMYEADGVAIDDIIVNTGALVAGETVVNNVPALTANDYIYLIEADTAAATGIYNAGQFIIKFYGHPLLT